MELKSGLIMLRSVGRFHLGPHKVHVGASLLDSAPDRLCPILTPECRPVGHVWVTTWDVLLFSAVLGGAVLGAGRSLWAFAPNRFAQRSDASGRSRRAR